MAFQYAWIEQNQGGRPCARLKRAGYASSRETASAVVSPSVCHAKAGCVLEAAADTSQYGLAPNRRPLADAVAFHDAWTDHNHRGAPRARRKRACGASIQEIASKVAPARLPRKSRLCGRPHLAHRTTVFQRIEETSRWRITI